MVIPAFVWMLIFSYAPMYGVLIAFKEYNVGLGVWNSPWVGFKYFRELLSDPYFINSLRNTLFFSFIKLIFGFPVTMLFALMLNELTHVNGYKRVVQTVSYMPYFLSWAFVASFLITITSDSGLLNSIAVSLGLTAKPVAFLGETTSFIWIILLSDVWKSFGYGSIIYLATMTSIDPQQYEAAIIDGSNRFQRIWHITLPGIKPTAVMLLILAISNMINTNFEQFYLLKNPMNADWSRVIDVYTYEIGLQKGRFSFGTAVGVFKSVVSFVLLYTANSTSRRLTGESIF